MENLPETTGDITLPCKACHSGVLPADAYCLNCGYPLHGSEMEQKTFLVSRDNLQLDIDDYNKKTKVAGNYLFILAALFVIAGLVAAAFGKDREVANVQLALDLILAVIFIALGAYSRRKPLACLISGLSLYIIVQLLNAVYSPITLVQGIIFKIIIIGFLVKGIKSAIEVDKIRKEHNLPLY